MPIYTFETEDGVRHKVEADTPEDAAAGFEHFLSTRNTTAAGAVEQGGSALLQGLGETAGQLGLTGVEGTLKEKAGRVAPQNYDPALTDERSLRKNPGYIPRALLESAAGPAMDLTAGAALSPLGPLGYLAGSTASYTARNLGNTAKEIAQNEQNQTKGLWRPWYMKALGIGDDVAPKEPFGPPDPNAPPPEPTLFQKARALGQTVGEGAFASLGPGIALGKFSKPLAETGVKGAFEAAKRFMVGTGVAAGTSAGTQAVHDFGVGNEQNATRLENAGVLGGAAGAALGGRRAAKETIAAAKFREITPELRPAAGEVGNMLNEGQSVRTAKQTISSDIKRIVSDNPDIDAAIKSNLDAAAAIERAKSLSAKRTLSGDDLSTLGQTVKGTQNEAAFMDAARRMRVLEVLEGKGDYTDSGDLRAGMTHKIGKAFSALKNPLGAAIGAGAGAAGLGAFPLALSAKSLAALGGVAALTYGADRALGLRMPARSFTEKFADGGATRVNPQAFQQPEQPQPTPPYQPPVNSTGPKMGLIQPWASRPEPTPEAPIDFKSIRDLVSGLERVNKMREASVPPEMGMPFRETGSMVRGLERIKKMREVAQAEQPPAGLEQAPVVEAPSSLLRNPAAPVATPSAPPAPAPAPTPVVPPEAAGRLPPEAVAPPPSMVNVNGVAHEIIRSPEAVAPPAAAGLPPTPMATIAKITKTNGSVKTKVVNEEPVGDGLDIPDFLRRDAKNALPTKPSAPSPASPAAQAAPSTNFSRFEKGNIGGMKPEELAAQITDRKVAAGGINHPELFRASTQGRIVARDRVADKLVKATGLPANDVRDVIRTASHRSQAEAILYGLKQDFPHLVKQLEEAFKGQWTKAWPKPKNG